MLYGIGNPPNMEENDDSCVNDPLDVSLVGSNVVGNILDVAGNDKARMKNTPDMEKSGGKNTKNTLDVGVNSGNVTSNTLDVGENGESGMGDFRVDDSSRGVKYRKVVAIVGSRRSTQYGREIAYELAKKLAERGAIIVSGLAYGIDAAAHKGALAGGGETVAVLGTAIDEISPGGNRGLACEILAQNGMIMSEYFPGEKVFTKTSYLERNRLIAGLADVVVVVEAAKKSGSLNTAAHAISENRDLWAVPGDIWRSTSEGCNRLIAQGAMPLVSIEEFLEEVVPMECVYGTGRIGAGGSGGEVNGRGGECGGLSLPKGENELENKIIRLIANGVNDGEQILAKIGISGAEFNVAITFLELRGVVKALGCNKWRVIMGWFI